MTHTLILKKPKITYRQFCLIQNSWIDLWTLDDEEEVIASMHPKVSSKLERVEILENGKEKRTLIWTNKESK
tara:strand:- start:573 stop:788 length:216 start_codon:yes stop_codon:yes gene_type:complete